jgi:hypothetical protein
MSYRDGLIRPRPDGFAHPLDLGFPTLNAARRASDWLRQRYGLVWFERDGKVIGHESGSFTTHGDGTAYRGE